MAQKIENIDEDCKDSWHNLILKANISVRATNVLHSNFWSLRKFMDYSPDYYYKLRHCGAKTKRELKTLRRQIQVARDQQGRQADTASPPDDDVFKLADSLALLKQSPNIDTLYLLPIYNYNKPVAITVDELHPDFKVHTPLNEFDFSIRTSNVLQNLKLKVIGELMVFPASDLMAQRNFGRKCLNEVRKVIIDFVLYGYHPLPSAKSNDPSQSIPKLDFASYPALISSLLQYCLNKSRDREIMSWRFNFDDKLPTLEQIGVQFNITRERVRQILVKQNRIIRVRMREGILSQFWETVKACIANGGGVISPADLAQKLQIEYHWPDAPNPIALIQFLKLAESEKLFTIAENMITVPCPCHTCDLPLRQLLEYDFEAHPSCHWRVAADMLCDHCLHNCQHTPVMQFHRAFLEKLVESSDDVLTFHNDLILPHGRWLMRHGKQLGPLIVQVLKDNGQQPMHFSEVAAAVRAVNLKHRDISDRNIHAAMVRVDGVIIAGRGTYGLKEWGLERYRSVSTAIEQLLKKSYLPLKRNIIVQQLTPEFTESNIYSALTIRENLFFGIGEGYFDLVDRWQKRTCDDFVALLPAELADFARYLLTNNNCSYKLVLAFVFIRDMNENGAFHLPTLKERFYNFYLSRYKNGEQVETPNIYIYRIGEFDSHQMISRICIEPLRSFSRSGFWFATYPKMINLKDYLIKQFLTSNYKDLMLITLLKAIGNYFHEVSLLSTNLTSNLTSNTSPYSKAKMPEMVSEKPGISSEETEDISTPSVTIKKKSRGLIKL